MKKKYLFFDIDGTLIYKDKHGVSQVMPSTIKTLKQLVAGGHFVAIATSRPHILTKDIAKQLNIFNYTSDGGDAYTLNDKLIENKPLNFQDSFALIKEAQAIQAGISVSVDTTNNRYSNDSSFIDQNPFLQDAFDFVVQEDFCFDRITKIHKMCLAITKEQEAQLPSLKKVPHYRLNDHCVLVEAIDKYQGILKIMNHLNAPKEDVVVFGGGINDLLMFEQAPYSIAMGNGAEALKAIASFVTKDLHDDGIEYACQFHGWIE